MMGGTGAAAKLIPRAGVFVASKREYASAAVLAETGLVVIDACAPTTLTASPAKIPKNFLIIPPFFPKTQTPDPNPNRPPAPR
jgi:hypothetical protein